MKVQRVLEYDCFFCDKCRNYFYDESAGDPRRGIEPKTRVEELSHNWVCPICGADRTALRASTLADEFWSWTEDATPSSAIADIEIHPRYHANHSKKI